ncbi:MAG: alpha/beta fold hydrolase [Blastocatellia bacterium]|nr:alpha/beta fold hydrolase [Blastocatellia bacterium]
MKKMILTFGFLVLGLSVGAQAPKSNHANEAVKPTTALPLPAFIAAEEITFKGDNVALTGTLYLPKNKAGQKVPAVLMVSEFYSSRDGVKVNNGQHTSYRDLAVHLVERGFAVLRYDRRCTGNSECNHQATMAVAGDDGVGGLKYLQGRPEVNPKKVFVFGHGDGSFIAASIAGHADVAGLIAVNAAGRNASKLLREWAKQRLGDRKTPEAETQKYLEHMEAVIQQLAAGGARTEHLKIDPKDDLLAPLASSPDYAYSWLLDDPLGLFPTVVGPILLVHGAKDRRIPTREGSYIRDALETGEHKDFETHLLPELDYFLKQNKGNPSYEADNDVSRPLDPALLKLIDEWLAKKMK